VTRLLPGRQTSVRCGLWLPALFNSLLGERGTEAAVATLAELASESPNQLRVTAALLVARTNVQASSWSPPSPTEVVALLSDKSRRLVRDSAEFATLLLETLSATRDELLSHAELLWDRHRPVDLPRYGGQVY